MTFAFSAKTEWIDPDAAGRPQVWTLTNGSGAPQRAAAQTYAYDHAPC